MGHLERSEGFKPGISVELEKEREKNVKINGVWEHTIPWEVFFYFLIKKKFTVPEELYEYLKNTYCQCRITTEEHERLKHAGFDRTMPQGWGTWRDRYENTKVRIELAVLPRNPSNPSLQITPNLL